MAVLVARHVIEGILLVILDVLDVLLIGHEEPLTDLIFDSDGRRAAISLLELLFEAYYAIR